MTEVFSLVTISIDIEIDYILFQLYGRIIKNMNQITQKKFQEFQKLISLNRLLILELLQKGETCVCEIVEKTHLKNNLVSHHLKVLSDLGYVDSSKQGLHNLYTLKKSKINNINNLFQFINHYD